MSSDGEKILSFFQSQASIFVPEVMSTDIHAPVSGQFLFQKDVIWKDETGCLDLLFQAASANSDVKRAPQYRALKIIYPSLQGFFLEECNVQDVLKFYDYYNVLKLLSNAFSPCEILDQVSFTLSASSFGFLLLRSYNYIIMDTNMTLPFRY